MPEGACVIGETCWAAQPTHPFKWGGCMERRAECESARCGVFLLHMRGTGNKFFREDVLDQLYISGKKPEQVVGANASYDAVEAETFADPELQSIWSSRVARGSATIVLLRHPVDRVLSRFWFEGRWDLFKTADAGKAVSLSEWFNKTRWPARYQRPHHMWHIPDNFYVKTFGGWNGKSMCVDGVDDDACRDGLAPKSLQDARAMLGKFDAVLLTEWLGAPAQIESLARLLCFATDGAGGPPRHQAAPDKPVWWHFDKIRRPAGGHSKSRPPRWRPPSRDLRRLWDANFWDLQFFRDVLAAARDGMTRRRVPDALVDALPNLPPIQSADAFDTWLDTCEAPSKDITARCSAIAGIMPQWGRGSGRRGGGGGGPRGH